MALFIIFLLFSLPQEHEGRHAIRCPRTIINSRELRDALHNDNCRNIILTSNIRLVDHWQDLAPVVITRDVEISGDDPVRVLDFCYTEDKIRVRPNVTMTFRNLKLQAVGRDFSQGLQFIGPSPGAMVKVVSCQHQQVACWPHMLKDLREEPRPQGMRGNQSVVERRAKVLGDGGSEQKEIDQLGVLQDVATFIGPSTQGRATEPGNGTHPTGEARVSYILWYHNTSLLCLRLIDQSCVDKFGPLCPHKLLEEDEWTHHHHYDQDERQEDSNINGRLIIILATLVPLTGLTAIGALVMLFIRNRRSSPTAHPQCANLEVRDSGCPSGITLGKLVGRGAYGRVYEGTWNGMRVAIKIVCSRGTGWHTRVTNEAKLSMTFNHPNVVTSYFYTSSVKAEVSGGSRGSREGGQEIVKWGGKDSTRITGEAPVMSEPVPEAALYVAGSSVAVRDLDAHVSGASGSSPGGLRGSNSSMIELRRACPFAANVNQFYRFDNISAGPPWRHAPQVSSPTSSPSLEAWIVQELCELGPLTRALISQMFKVRARGGGQRGTNLLHVLLRARDVARGMSYLHSLHVCHGDLKPDNILLVHDARDPMGCRAKVADFGISRALTEGKSHLSTQTLGTVTHMSPELLVRGRLGQEADVYSFGIMMWELASCRIAYQGVSPGEVIQKVVVEQARPVFHQTDLPVWGQASSSIISDYCQLACNCWHQEMEKRPAFEEIVRRLDHMVEAMMCRDQGWELGTVCIRINPWGYA